MMGREEILLQLRRHWAEIRERFGVEQLAIFGSTARDEARPDSDVDILVRFAKPPGYDGYFALKCYLESLLGRQVDLVMEKALKSWARPVVEQEAVYVKEC